MASSKSTSATPRKAKRKSAVEKQATNGADASTAGCGHCQPLSDKPGPGNDPTTPTNEAPCSAGCPSTLSIQHYMESVSGCLSDLEKLREDAKIQLQQLNITDTRRKVCSDIVVDTTRATMTIWATLYPF